MTDATDTQLIAELRRLIADQQRQITDLKHQNQDLRAAIAALLAPNMDARPE